MYIHVLCNYVIYKSIYCLYVNTIILNIINRTNDVHSILGRGKCIVVVNFSNYNNHKLQYECVGVANITCTRPHPLYHSRTHATRDSASGRYV